MVGHRQVERAALFDEFSLERHVPRDHLLRSLDRYWQSPLERAKNRPLTREVSSCNGLVT